MLGLNYELNRKKTVFVSRTISKHNLVEIRMFVVQCFKSWRVVIVVLFSFFCSDDERLKKFNIVVNIV